MFKTMVARAYLQKGDQSAWVMNHHSEVDNIPAS
jgi:hypothetical protein